MYISEIYLTFESSPDSTEIAKVVMEACVREVAAIQTCMHVDDNNLDELYQSAYKKHHSTETALLKVKDDILWAIAGQ